MKILLASNNAGKVERLVRLLKEVNPTIELRTPSDLGVGPVEVEEVAGTLAGNAELKACAYVGKVGIPILSNDTGFYVEGEGFVEAPKRTALAGHREQEFSKEERARKMIDFWKKVAGKYGGEVDAAWIESFVVVYPDGSVEAADSRREVLLTNQEFGEAHIEMPVRALYLSKATNKPANFHTKEEELLEMQPVIAALKKVLRIS